MQAIDKENASHWQRKCKSSITLLRKLQVIVEENGSHIQIYYIKCKSLAKKKYIVDKFAIENASYWSMTSWQIYYFNSD